MSTINRFLSRREKHSTASQSRKEVLPHHSSSENSLPSASSSTSLLNASTSSSVTQTSKDPQQCRSSPRRVSLAFSALDAKKSPRLQLATDLVERTIADRDYLLQPKQTNGPLNGLFIDDRTKSPPEKEEEKKIKAISQRLARAGIVSFKDDDISYVLNAEYAKTDVEKAYELLAILKDSEEGIVQPYNRRVKLLGAVNRQGVTCYLDALLFAMFARLGSFEAMLYKNFEDPAKLRLVILLRLWVNILRAGKLITVDITKQIQLQLANCGWPDAAKLRQQDASEAFTFITGTLALPLLTLKMDIFHTGREDATDDHKFINERLLELAIPEEADDKNTVTLEECLELFFNNKIEVKRYLETLERRNTLGSVRSRPSFDSAKGRSTHIEVAEVEEGQPSTPQQRSLPAWPQSPPAKLARRRAPSIIQETYFDEKKAGFGEAVDETGHPRRSRKEVMMPAWQFFSLIPWYTNNMPSNDAQVAAHFSSTRPVLGICLKRYYMTNAGRAMKRTTHVDIPLEIGLPHFIQDDNMSEDGPAFGNFKLSLQSVVCHQGISTESGHYISLVRNPDQERPGNDKWMRFDDLASERVIEIDAQNFLKESTSQTPYLLFYQVIPIEDDTPSYSETQAINGGDPPPSYADSVASKDSKTNPEPARASLEVSHRNSVDIPSSEESHRGRSSLTVDQRQSILLSSEDTGTTSSTSASSKLAKSENPSRWSATLKSVLNDNTGGSSNGPNSLTATRQTVQSNKTGGSKSRGTSRSDDRAEKRMSASLSRLAGRFSGSRDRLSTAIASSTNGVNNGSSTTAATGPVPLSPLPGSPSAPGDNPNFGVFPPSGQIVEGDGNTVGQQQQISSTSLTSQAVSATQIPPPSSAGNDDASRQNSTDLGRLWMRKEKNVETGAAGNGNAIGNGTIHNENDPGNGMENGAASGSGKPQQHHHHHHHQNHLTKSGPGGGKPDRECLVM